MMVADVVPGDDFGVSGAAPFIDPWTYGSHSPSRAYDVLADGSLIVSQYESGSAGTLLWFQERFRVDEFHVVLNFFEELRTRAGN
jgi:hypothetical protein